MASAIFALDPSREVSQYIHNQWTVKDGFPGGLIYGIAQTADGYLWIGCEKGLIRFDGINFKQIRQADEPSLPDMPIVGLTTDAAGDLWIRLKSSHVLRYHEGKFNDVVTTSGDLLENVIAIARTQKGEILLGTVGDEIYKVDKENVATLVFSFPKGTNMPRAMVGMASGDIWVDVTETGLFRYSGGVITEISEGLPDPKINSLVPDGDNGLWIGTDKGLARWDGTKLTTSGVPPELHGLQIQTALQDSDASLWIGTEALGLVRLNRSGIVSSAKTESGDSDGNLITAFFQDREGNLWIGSAQGIERLHDSAFVTYSVDEGLPSDKNGAIYVDPGGRVWFAPLDGGLYWFKGKQVEKVSVGGLASDVVYSIAGNGDDLWVGRQHGGLTHLQFINGSIVEKTFTERDGLAQDSVYSVYVGRDKSVWAGTLSGGVSHLKDDKITNYSAANGLSSNSVTAVADGPDGVTWFATPNGLESFSNNNWRSITVQDGLPSGDILSLLMDSHGVLWIGTSKGLAFLSGGQILNVPQNIPALHEQIFGLAEDNSGCLLVATESHVLRIGRDKLINGSLDENDVRQYDLFDGLRSDEGVRRNRSIVADGFGHVWISLGRGISMIDPSRIADVAPAIAQIQSISADGKPVEIRGDGMLPAARQRLIFSYAGLSLTTPERVRFRYFLEGFDKGWSEPTNAREAVYTNLDPGNYVFHVLASNSDGIWNGTETAVRFRIEPAFWQTFWFRLLVAIAIGAVIFGLVRMRTERLTRALNARFEERLAERTRIAHDLHDSLLQSVVSASMQLDVAVDHLPDSVHGRQQFDRVLQLMRIVIDEGRSTLRELRSPAGDRSESIEKAFANIHLESERENPVDFEVVVQGESRDLRPMARDEVYYIGREALLNAYRHSEAEKIEVVVEYAPKHLRIVVRDDGCGIDSGVLQNGREGHWGIVGMRERAKEIGAVLKLRSRRGVGTEIELQVPNHIAFDTPGPSKPILRFFRAPILGRSGANERRDKKNDE